MNSTWKKAALLGAFTWLVYCMTCTGTSGDSQWSIPTARSLLYEGNADLNEYDAWLDQSGFHAIESVDGRHYTMFPVAISVVALPFVAGAEGMFRVVAMLSPELEAQLLDRSPVPYPYLSAVTFYWRLEQIIASLFCAVAVALFYVYACNRLPPRRALLVSLLLAFCTSTWSVAATALWQHGPSLLMIVAALLVLQIARENDHRIQYLSIPLALAYVIRPTNSIALVILTVFVAIRHRQYLVKYLSWAMVVFVPFCAYNIAVYSALLPPYFMPGRLGGNDDFWIALVANIISPARGLFVYSPILLFAVIGAVHRLKQPNRESLDYYVMAILALHWVAISSFPHWWGGKSFGPRFFTDVLPFLLYFLIPVLSVQRNAASRYWLTPAVFILLAAASLAIHYRGASSASVWAWNDTPVSVDEDPSRIWDWGDLSFLRTEDR